MIGGFILGNGTLGTRVPPTDDLEPAMVVTLLPGAYTAIVSGKSGKTGVALAEVYHLTP